MSVLTDLRQLRGEVGDVIARHEQARSVTDFAKYADDPAGFLRDVLRCEPWEMQVTMAESVRDHPRVSVVSCNSLGKDWLAARVALWWTFARRGYVILTGPTERQVRYILMKQVRAAFAAAPELPGELYALELRVSEDSGILAFTSDNADRLTGFHHPRLLIIITEGQGVEDAAYEAAQACCTSPANRLLVCGNPTRPTGAFVRAADSDAWHTLTIPASAHPNVISGREEIPGAVSREWVQMMREEYGEGSSIYRSRVLAQFPTESLEGLLNRAWIRAAFERHEDKEFTKVAALHPLLLALDIARFGPDSSVLAVVRGPIVQQLITWRGASITDSVDKVIGHAERLMDCRSARPRIVVDEPGMGGGAIDILRAKGWPVTAFNGAAKARDARRFLNQRAESHWKLRELLENNRVALPRDSALEEEGLAVEWQLTVASGTVQMLSKDTMRATLGRSPDRLDAVVMGLGYAMGVLSPPTITISSWSPW